MAKKFVVYIETKGDPISGQGPRAHIPALPGAAARGKTIEEAKENIRQAVIEYLRLLRNVGEPVPRVREGLEFEFEEVDTTTFLTDYDALRPNEMETMFRWMAVSRQELMDLVRDLPQEALDWRKDEQSPSIREILCRLAEADLWYTDRLIRWPEAPLFRLAAARGVALERLRELSEEKRAGITTFEGEEWTPRKVIRRMLEFEREMILEIKDILSQKGGD
ncbi:MAG: hypothetical protein D6784_02515 [Chloroflexi bacterium]|nr:MAG: hypothetical protein D6784_02515 [Chloroflexota bacterium]